MKFRPHEWLNTNNNKPMYGIQGQIHKGEEWVHICEGKTPCIYKTEEERDLKLKELNEKINI